MKVSLIALIACCALTSTAFALQDDPGIHPPQPPPQISTVD